jgi:hypothetical protein
MEVNGSEWNQEIIGIRTQKDSIDSNEFNWIQMDSTGFKWTQMESNGIK